MHSDSHSQLISDFSVHVAAGQGGGTVVTVFGELDLATAPRVRSALDQAIRAEGDVLVDLRACNFVDSTGIAILAGGALRLKDQGRRLILRGVRERVERIFQLAGLSDDDSVVVEPFDPEPHKGKDEPSQ